MPGGYLSGAPDLAIEVISPGNSRREIAEKTAEYFAAGCRAVWVVDAVRRTVTIARPHETTVVSEAGVLDGGDILPGFRYPLSRLFGS